MQRIAVTIHAGDPISRAGLVGQLRYRPEVTLVEPGPAEGAAPGEARVAVVVAEAMDEATTVLLRRLHRTEGTRLVLVASRVRDSDLPLLVECEVAAVVWRAEASEEGLVRAILAAAKGEGNLPPDLLGRLMAQMGRVQRSAAEGRPSGVVGLSDRERDVLRLVAQGLDSGEIAGRLSYSERTVKNVLYGVMTRMNLRNRPHAVAHVMREGYL